MQALTYRAQTSKLSFCPRCELTCGCGGHRVAQSSQAVPRSFTDSTFLDAGFWCWCCFIQMWDEVDDATKAFLVAASQTPGRWVTSASLRRGLDHAASQWEEACRRKGFGVDWRDPGDEENLTLVAAPGVGDVPFATARSASVQIAIGEGVARLVERASAKDARAARRR